MLTIIEGSRDNVVAEMRAVKEYYRLAVKNTKARLRDAKYLLKKARDDNAIDMIAEHANTVNEEQYTLHRLNDEMRLDLSTTKILPVALEGQVYNLKLLESIGRKLRGFDRITLDVDHEGTMFIRYTNKGNSGHMEIQPLSPWYTSMLREVPKAVSSYRIASNEPYYKGLPISLPSSGGTSSEVG